LSGNGKRTLIHPMEKAVKRPNFLLYGFILISLFIHVIVFLHVAGIYKSQTISYIELSMDQLAKPDVRKIPRPRIREKAPEISQVKTLQVKKLHFPKIKVEAMEKPMVDSFHGTIDLPQLPDNMDVSGFFVPGLKVAGIKAVGDVANVQVQEAPVEFINAKDYFEMLHLRIHSFKKYPVSAKSSHTEGRVKVQFVLLADGTLKEVKILKSSRHKNLDDAAIDAIQKAAPFPKPPTFLFKIPVTLRIDILFELT